MSSRQKLLLMFVPLLLAFLILAIVIDDLKHPTIRFDQCRLVGRGLSVQAFKQEARLLYTSSGKPEDDLGLQCDTLGSVVVNEDVPLPPQPEKSVHITIKTFKYLPTRYYVSVPVVNPDEADPGLL